jgi:hypothetical protein
MHGRPERRRNMAEEHFPRFRRRISDEVVVEPNFTWAVSAERPEGGSPVVTLKLTNPDQPEDDFVRLGFSRTRAQELVRALSQAIETFGPLSGPGE